MKAEENEIVCPDSRGSWRTWLQEHHQVRTSVWLLYHKKHTGKPTVSWEEAVEEALCFGWIDSTKKTVDKDTFMQLFSRRKPGGTWSKINKDKIGVLTDAGLMMPAGLESVRIAMDNGAWTLLDEAEALVVPMDLRQALEAHEGAETYFDGLSRSARKMLLMWLVLAKRKETREKRIHEIASQAARQTRPKPFL